MTCDDARSRMARAAEGPAEDADVLGHVEHCNGCRAMLEDHMTVRYLLSTHAVDAVAPGFAGRVRARIAPRASPFGWTDWKSWTLRLAPVAVGLAVVALVRLQRVPVPSLEAVMEHWMTGRRHVPVIGLFWHDAPQGVLLEAVLEGQPDVAMRSYFTEGQDDH